MAAPLPKEPMPGDPLDADWGRAVARALRSQRVSAGPGLRASQGPDGTTLSLAASPGRRGPWAREPVIASVPSLSPLAGKAPCLSLDGEQLGKRPVAAIELAGGGGSAGGPYRVVAYPAATLAAAIEEVGAS